MQRPTDRYYVDRKSKLQSPSGLSSQSLLNQIEEGKERLWESDSQRRWRTPEEHGPLNQLSRARTGLPESKWPAWSCTRSYMYIYVRTVSLVVFSNSGNGCVLYSFTCSWDSYFCWVVLSSLTVRAFILFCCIVFCHVWLTSLGVCSFLKGHRDGLKWGGS